MFLDMEKIFLFCSKKKNSINVVVIISKLHPWIRCTFQTSLQFIKTYRLQTKVISELN